MRQKFKIYRDLDTVHASRIMFALQDTGNFNNFSISTSGLLEIETCENITTEKLQQLLAMFTDLYIVEIKSNG